MAATCCHGLFRSADAGVTWTHPLAESIYIRAVAGNAGFFFAGSDTGLYRSSDQGRTWAHFPFAAGLSDSAVGPFAVVGTTLFAGSHRGVFHSQDNGGSWTRSPLEVTFIDAMAARGGDLFVASFQGLFQSSDQGGTWVKIDAGLPSNNGYPPYVSCLAASGGSLFVGISNGGIWSRPLAELTATLHATKVPESGKNPGYRRFWGVQVDGRALTLRERLPRLPNPK